MKYENIMKAGSVAAMLLLSACSGSSGSSSTTNTGNGTTGACTFTAGSTSICGLAAAGKAITGMVYAYDVNGTISPVATIAANGKYQLDTTGLTPPLKVVAMGVSNLEPAVFYSMASTKDLVLAAGDVNKRVNITPLTDVVLAHASGRPAADIPSTALTAVEAQIATAVTAVNTIVTPLTQAVGATINDPLTDSFNADGTGEAKVLESLNVVPAKQGGTIDIRLAGNNISLGTVTLPATPGGAVTTTVNNTVTAAQLTQAQSISAAAADIQVCMNALSALYTTSVPTAAQVQAFLDPNFSGWGMNAAGFATYFTAAPPNGRGQIGLTFNGGGIADFDMTPPAAGATIVQPLAAPVTFGGANGTPTSMWVAGQVAGMSPIVKFVKNAPYTGCPSGWQMAGNLNPLMSNVQPGVIQSIATAGAAPTYSRNLLVRMDQWPVSTLLSLPNAPTPQAGVAIVTGPGFATYQGVGVAPTPTPSITLATNVAAPTLDYMPIQGFAANPNAISLPYCSDAGQTVGDPCFDDTVAAPGSLYNFSLRTQAASTVVVQEFTDQYQRAELPYADVVANAASIFPTITAVTPNATTLLNTANTIGLAGTSMAGIGGFSYTVPSSLTIATSGQLWISGGGVPLDIFSGPTPMGSGSWTVPAGATKTTSYTTANSVRRILDSTYLGYLTSVSIAY